MKYVYMVEALGMWYSEVVLVTTSARKAAEKLRTLGDGRLVEQSLIYEENETTAGRIVLSLVDGHDTLGQVYKVPLNEDISFMTGKYS